MIDNKQIQQLMDKQMSRKSFFAHIGAAILAVVGVTGLVKNLQDYTDKSIRKANGSKSNNTTTVKESGVTSVATKTNNYTITDSDDIILADASRGAFAVTLPTAVSSAKTYTVKKVDGSLNTVTMNTTSFQTIDGGPSALMKVQNVSITVASDNSNWMVI